MTEATVEEMPVDEASESPQSERPLERAVEEADVEANPADRKNYGSEPSKDKYSKIVEYKKSQKETSPKKASVKSSGGLEKAVEDAQETAKKIGVDPSELLSLNLTERVYANNEAREVPDSSDGGHVIVAYDDPKTGKLHFSFEKKPADYPIINGENNAGKLSLYGGSIKIGEPPNEGLGREIWEEDRDSHKIIIKALNETRWKVDEIKKNIDGVPSTTYIWLVYIKDPIEVRNYLSSKSTEGEKTILSLDEVLKTKDSDFAFGFGPIVKKAGIALANSKYSNYRYN